MTQRDSTRALRAATMRAVVRSFVTLTLLAALGAILSVWFVASALGEDLAPLQREVAERYQRLEAAALRIADLAEAAARDEGNQSDVARAEQIRAAVRQARALELSDRFERVVTLLEGERLAAAQGDQAELAASLEELLRVVTTDPRESRLEEERRRIERLAKELRKASREQRDLRNRTERVTDSAVEDSEPIGDEQRELADRVAGLGELAQPSDGAPPAFEAKQSEEGGEPSDAQPSNAKPSLGQRVQGAAQAMREASERLAERRRDEAAERQRDAERALEAARREAEETLRQLREEERQQRLASLAERLARMHAQQQRVLGETRKRSEATSEGDDRGRAAELAAASLADRQGGITRDARRALNAVREDGRSLVFADALDQAARDSAVIDGRLRAERLNAFTVRLEEDLAASLAEMLAAVEQELDDLQSKQQSQGGPSGGAGGEASLVSQLAELRVLRSVQARLARQAATWAEATRLGEATPEAARERLAEIAEAQRRLADAAQQAAAVARP